MICVEPEIIQCAEANRVGVAILLKGFGIPGYGITDLIYGPRHAAVTLVVASAILRPAGMLRRCMKSDVGDVYSGSNGHAERLDRAIEVFVIERVFVMVNTRRRIAHLVSHKPDAIVSRVRLLLAYHRPCPSRNGGLHSPGYANRRKRKARCATNKELTVGSVVIHVALPGIGLTPLILLRRQVLCFSEIGCALILRCVEVTDINANPVRCANVVVASVVGWIWIR